jgi:epoxyqueuosine reductase QueG
VSDEPAWQARPGLRSPALLELCLRSDAEWSTTIKGSAMKRAGVRRIRRSLALAAAHLPPAEAHRALSMMEGQPSASQPDVAEAIAWARARASQPPGEDQAQGQAQ